MSRSSDLRGRRQRGVTMLEVLIAILVLSFGLLGMLGIILNSLKLTSSSNYRTIAAMEAYALADGLRASVPQLQTYLSADAAADASCIGATATGCAENKIVETEIELWTERLAASLPAGTGALCRDSDAANDGNPDNWRCSNGTGDPYVIKVCWDESRVAGAQTGNWQCVRTNI